MELVKTSQIHGDEFLAIRNDFSSNVWIIVSIFYRIIGVREYCKILICLIQILQLSY